MKKLITSLFTWTLIGILFSINFDKTISVVIFRFCFMLVCWILVYNKSIWELIKN